MRMTRQRPGVGGSVTLLTLFILTFLALLGTGFLALIPVEMRNAKHDRAAVQAGYGADAALLRVMDQLAEEVPWQAIALNSPEPLSGGWQFQVEKIEPMEEGVFRVTTSGLLDNKVRRRAVAVIDNGVGEFALRFTTNSTSGTQSINSEGAWPVNVPVSGDIFIQGTWYLDNTGFDLSSTTAERPFKGVIFQTDPSGEALRGEQYVATAPSSAAEYAALYDYGMQAVQTLKASKITDDQLFLRAEVRDDLLGLVFATDNSGQIRQARNQVSGRIHVTDKNGDGLLDGGLLIPGDADLKFSYDPTSGVGTTEITDASGVMVVETEKNVFPNSVDHPDRLTVTVGTSVQTYQCHLTKGFVTYVDGEIRSVEGTFLGNQTVAAARGITITNELLKSDTPRGSKPDGSSTDALGLIACVDGGSNDPGMSIDMQSVPSDREYFVYAYLTALSHNDVSAKMFSQSQHPALPLGTTLTLIGSMTWAPTTAGQINTAMDFISSWDEVVLDSFRPLGFPDSSYYIPRIRSYVDLPVGQ